MDKQIVSAALAKDLVQKMDIIVLAKKTSRSAIIASAVNRLVNDSYKDAKKKVKAMIEEKEVL